jgi:hypothetical protein
MKKFLLVLSVCTAFSLSVAPSQALVGIPDRVPANELIGFFVVAVDGNLDTLIVVQEIGAHGMTATNAYSLHWTMWDPASKHKADRSIPYTKNDVVAISCRDIIFNSLTPSDRKSLEADLDTDGTNESYIGYITWNDELAGAEINDANHFVGNMYIVDLASGIGSGVSIAGREALLTAGWMDGQSEASDAIIPAFTGVLEGFSPFAYAITDFRQRNNNEPSTTLPGDFYFRLLPRWYLYTDAGENNIFIWKSFNAPSATVINAGLSPGESASEANGSFSMMVYDNEENYTSKQVDISRELNFIDVRDVVPPDWMSANGNMGGWFDIRSPSNSAAAGNPTGWQYMDFLCYSWQRSANAGAGLNWSALFESHREVGTLNASG